MSLRDSYKKVQFDGGGSDFKKPFALVDGKNLFRVIPPLPGLSPDGKWFKYVAQHFGYKVTNRDGKEVLRTFVCPRNFNPKTKEEKHPCAECSKIERQKDLLKKREVQYAEQGKGPDEILELTAPLRDWLSSHNRDTKYLVHVMNAAGEFGYVKLPSTAYYQMKERGVELGKAGIDALSPDQGVWFSINKSGQGFKTEYSTTVEMESTVVNGRRMQTEKLAPLTDEQLESAVAQCPKFDGLVYVVSDEQITQLANSSGSAEEATVIFGAPVRREGSASSPAPVAKPQVRVQEEALPPSRPVTAGSSRGEPLADYAARVKSGIGANAPAAAPEVDDEEAIMEAKLAAIKAKKAAVANGRVAKPSPAMNPNTSTEDFINQFGEE